MIKLEVAKSISEKTGVSVKTAETMIEAFTETIHESLKSGEKVSLRGFGTFLPALQKERTARNISTGATITVPERTVARFKPSKTGLKL